MMSEHINLEEINGPVNLTHFSPFIPWYLFCISIYMILYFGSFYVS